MRIPLFSGPPGRPIAWWEWLFAPLLWPIAFLILFVLGLLSIPYFAVYPDRHAHEYDFGTDRQQAVMMRYRRFTSRVPLWRRIVRAIIFPLRRRPIRLFLRRA